MRSLKSIREEIERPARGLPPSPTKPVTPSTATETTPENTPETAAATAADHDPPADNAPSSHNSAKP